MAIGPFQTKGGHKLFIMQSLMSHKIRDLSLVTLNMCTKFKNKILKTDLFLSYRNVQGNFYRGSGTTDLNRVYTRLLSGGMITDV